jgi:hypothetical protein
MNLFWFAYIVHKRLVRVIIFMINRLQFNLLFYLLMANNIWSRTGSFRDACYVIIPYICLLCKSNKTFGMFYPTIYDEGNNPVEN